MLRETVARAIPLGFGHVLRPSRRLGVFRALPIEAVMRRFLVLALVVFPLVAIPLGYLGWTDRERGQIPLWAYAAMFAVPALATFLLGVYERRWALGLMLAPVSGFLGYVAVIGYVLFDLATCDGCIQ